MWLSRGGGLSFVCAQTTRHNGAPVVGTVLRTRIDPVWIRAGRAATKDDAYGVVRRVGGRGDKLANPRYCEKRIGPPA